MLVSAEAAGEAILSFERFENYRWGTSEDAMLWRARLMESVQKTCAAYDCSAEELVQYCLPLGRVADDNQLIEAGKALKIARALIKPPQRAAAVGGAK